MSSNPAAKAIFLTDIPQVSSNGSQYRAPSGKRVPFGPPVRQVSPAKETAGMPCNRPDIRDNEALSPVGSVPQDP
ncbi:hypothetical protein GCM10007052_15460 [Halioglobus japonicus]|nr:hypothetical protein GCM10007052_15460 [Halioglobus japonicus]